MKKVILLPTFLLIFFGCVSQPRIFTDIDKNYNPAEYNTYIIEGPKLEDSPSQLSVNPILLQRIERAIHLALEDRGLSESKLTEWKTYRQKLRDFDFSSYDIGDEITWPTLPE